MLSKVAPNSFSKIAALMIAVSMLIGFSGLVTQIVVGKILLSDVPIDGRYFALKSHGYVEISELTWNICKVQIAAFMSLWVGAITFRLLGYFISILEYSRKSE